MSFRPSSVTHPSQSRFRQQLQQQRRCWIGTIRKQMMSKSIGSRWVSFDFSFKHKTLTANLLQVLHPRHKLAYFAHAGWEPDWVNTARELVEQEYECNYENLDVDESQEVAVGGEQSKTSKVCLYHRFHTVSWKYTRLCRQSASIDLMRLHR